MNDAVKTNGIAETTVQINRSLAVSVMVLAVLAVVLLPDGVTEAAFTVLVYSSVVFLITLPLDYMIPPLRIAAEFFAELLHLAGITVFCSGHRGMVCAVSGVSSFCLWLPLAGLLFTGRENFWLMLFFVYAAIWALFFHAAAMAEKREPLPDAAPERQEQHSNLFWTVWAMLLSGCIAGCLLPLVPYTADLFSGEQPQATSYQIFLTAVCAAGLIMLGVIGAVYRRYEKSVHQAWEKMQLQNQIQQGQMYITLLTEKYRSLQRYQHDFKKHLAYIRQLAVQNRPEEIAAYIAVVQEDLQQGALLRLTGNQTLDLLLSDYVQQAEKNGVTLQIHYQPQVKLHHITAPDLCVMLGNLLDNAITAAAESDRKQIDCEFRMKNDYYTAIQITNSCGQMPVMKEGIPQSQKTTSGHGYGVQNVLRCAEKNHGVCSFSCDAKTAQFQAVLLLPGQSECES